MSKPLETSIKTMIKEAFDGPANPRESWFTNNTPNSGVFGALEGISSREASVFVNGTTLAGHTNHVCTHMWGTNQLLKGGTYPEVDWKRSWEPSSVTEEGWIEVQAQLRSEYVSLVAALEDGLNWNQLTANEVLGSLAHSAYHLGAIRQILKIVKTGQTD